MSFRIGDSVGDYTILEELGAGGSGRVFKVEHNITRRKEAMKVLTGTTQSVRESFLRFLHEIRLQAALTHLRE
jgi:serine/threonine-protein kinase